MKFTIFCFVLLNIYSEEEKVCNWELLGSHGLVGLNTPSTIAIEMCPSIHETCCSKKD